MKLFKTTVDDVVSSITNMMDKLENIADEALVDHAYHNRKALEAEVEAKRAAKIRAKLHALIDG